MMRDYSRIHVTIVGFGNVGRCVLNLLLQDHHRQFHFNVMDPSPHISGSQRDLGHASMINKRHRISWNDPHLFNRSEFVIYCAGQAVPLGKTRDFAREQNRQIAFQVFKDFRPENNPTVITLTNPLDVIAHDIFVASGLPTDNVIGIGTIVETMRFEYLLSQMAGVDPTEVKALVIGEHGESMVPVLSHTFIRERPVIECLDPDLIRDCIYETRRAPYRIKETQGASYFAASNAAVFVLQSLLSMHSEVIPLSIYHPADDLFYSVPVSISRCELIPMVMSLDVYEIEALETSKSRIRYISQGSAIDPEMTHINY